MAHRVCSWWIGYLLASPVRRWMGQHPEKILAPYVREGMTVLEPGPGMGFFTIPLAQIVGDAGRVIAVDVQPKMIAALKKRAAKANVRNRVDARITSAETMGLRDVAGKIDFTLAFAIVHEFPDAQRFFEEVADASRTGAKVLLAEPRGHVHDAEFEKELSAAAKSGLRLLSRPQIARSHGALLEKK